MRGLAAPTELPILLPEVWFGRISPLELHVDTGHRRKRGKYEVYFIIAHFVGTDTRSDIQANMTRGNIRLGEFCI